MIMMCPELDLMFASFLNSTFSFNMLPTISRGSVILNELQIIIVI